MANSKKTKLEIEQENELLKQLVAQLTANKTAVEEKPNNSNKKDVTLTSLTEGTLVLHMGDRFLTIDGQFNAIKLTKAQARDIVTQNPQAYLKGLYVLDGIGNEIDDIFTSYELEQARAESIKPEQLRDVLNQPLDVVEQVYKRVGENHKRTMQQMLSNKILSGQKVDIRLKELMTNLSGKDFINLQPYDDETLAILRQHGATL